MNREIILYFIFEKIVKNRPFHDKITLWNKLHNFFPVVNQNVIINSQQPFLINFRLKSIFSWSKEAFGFFFNYLKLFDQIGFII